MKKVILVAATTLLVAFVMTGCESTPSPEATMGRLARTADIPSENNTVVDAYQTRIVNWDGKIDGESPNPTWLRTMRRSNGRMYAQAYGLDEVYGTHHWFTATAESPSLATAETLAAANVLMAVAQEMFTTVSASLGSQVNGGQRAAISNVCAQTDATLTGVGRRGQFWRQVETVDDNGNQTREYYYYIFYSCDELTYQNLLAVYMRALLNDRGLDEETVNVISRNRQKIIQDALDRSEERGIEKERELIRQRDEYYTQRTLSNNQTRQVEAQQRTAQVQARTEADASISQSRANAATAVTSATGSAIMSPALASLLSNL